MPLGSKLLFDIGMIHSQLQKSMNKRSTACPIVARKYRRKFHRSFRKHNIRPIESEVNQSSETSPEKMSNKNRDTAASQPSDDREPSAINSSGKFVIIDMTEQDNMKKRSKLPGSGSDDNVICFETESTNADVQPRKQKQQKRQATGLASSQQSPGSQRTGMKEGQILSQKQRTQIEPDFVGKECDAADDTGDYVVIDDSSSDEVYSLSSTCVTVDDESDNDIDTCDIPVLQQPLFIEKVCGNELILFMDHNCEVVVAGKAMARCIRGRVSVLGYELVADGRSHPIYCPRSASLLSLKAMSTPGGDGVDCVGSTFHDPELLNLLKRYPVVVLFSQLQCPVVDFIVHQEKFRTLFSSRTGSIELPEIHPVDKCNDAISIPQEFIHCSESFVLGCKEGKHPSVAVCGGLNVGKSTFGRFLINRALNHVPQVAYIECDVGQTEFTPPCCVSLTLVSSPLLGPPFTHQQSPISSVFVGRTSPASCSRFYVQCLKHVYKSYLNLPMKCPLIINTMGWMKDIGLTLLVDTLRVTKPDYVMQLSNRHVQHVKHLPLMTPEYLASLSGTSPEEVETSVHHYKWIEILSVHSRYARNQTYNAACRRELAVLAYFGQLFDSNSEAMSLQVVVPYQVPWSRIAIHACHELVSNSQLLYVINGNIVALCSAKNYQIIDSNVDQSPKFLRRNQVCDCVGFGIVRSINVEKRMLYVLTPIDPSCLTKVNCLICGAVRLPTCLLTGKQPTACVQPYIDYVQKVPKVRRQSGGQAANKAHRSADISNTDVE